MNPAVMVLANKSLAFSLYDFHLSGVSASELAVAHSMPVYRVEELIESVRLSLKFQVKVALGDQRTIVSRLAA